MDRVLLINNEIIHKNITYDYKEINKIKKVLSNKVMFILADNLKIDKYDLVNIKGKSEEEIIDDINIDEDILVHNIVDRKLNCKYIYTIRGGNLLTELIDNKKYIKVKPVQFIMKKIIKGYAKRRNCYRGIIKFFQKIYIIDIENNKIINTRIISNEEFEKINNILLKDDVIIDSYFKGKIDRDDLTYVNIEKKIERYIYGL